ncbi:hypothetical protein LPC08_21410 [Roseomonas sp. OT10]|uniref:hypothetical protein n=1 Tax=Roseomonas cutis TaxID=2897332 RepID=UPI001E4D511E|nr:hypothetical protein [Roseomonas sp. OT10]UFN48541.1 hypothetical protein LPC08_21410 [Roseomonas sp. OT10]
MLRDGDTRWQALQIQGWYGEGEREVEICTATAVWRHGGMPIVPIRWVLIRDPQRRFSPQALLCTDLHRAPEQILGWFVQRWQLEVTFQETRAHLGVETQRQWSDLAIARTTHACSRCSPSSPSWLPGSSLRNKKLRPAVPGIANHVQPSATPSPPCDVISGESRVCSRHGAAPTAQNPAQPYNAPWPMPSATPRDS